MTVPAHQMPEHVVPTSPAQATAEPPADHPSDRAAGTFGNLGDEPDAPASRRVARPIALVAVIAVGITILTACLFGAALSGLFSDLFTAADGKDAGPLEVTVGPETAQQATVFDDGLWLVGRDILPGTYQTTVPATSAGCAWERASSADGTQSSMIESGAGGPGVQVVVTIKPTDGVFRSHDCGRWLQIAPPDAT